MTKTTMTKDTFLKRMAEIYDANVEISRKKNADYASGDDPFGNFRISAAFGVPVSQAILVRMSDKMARIANLLQRPAQVADESILDSLSDLANYSVILRMWLEENQTLAQEIARARGETS